MLLDDGYTCSLVLHYKSVSTSGRGVKCDWLTHQFSIISLIALAGLCITSPAAILLTTASSSLSIVAAIVQPEIIYHCLQIMTKNKPVPYHASLVYIYLLDYVKSL